MNWAVIFVGFVLPALIGGALGYAVGYRRAHVLGLVLHVVLGGATILLWTLMERASWLDGIAYLIVLFPVAICWATYIIAHLIGNALRQ